MLLGVLYETMEHAFCSHSFSCRTGNKDVYNKLMEFRQKVDEESISICINVIVISNLSGRSGFF